MRLQLSGLWRCILALLAAHSILFALGVAARGSTTKPKDAVQLSSIQTLTLRKDKMTTHRRVKAIPQLKCIGGDGKGLYDVDVMRCTNAGADYDDASVQWTCRASLPPEFKLGSTDVICEGYSNPDDPFVLKGSCGVEYRLLLTELGEQKYGKRTGWWGNADYQSDDGQESLLGKVFAAVFWLAVIAVFVMVIIGSFRRGGNDEGNPGPRPARGGWGGGGGGPGGGDDPPPPYDWGQPRPKPSYSYSSGDYGQQAWRPGFWSGAATGAAAGYAAASMANNRRTQRQDRDYSGGGGGGSGWFGGSSSGESSSAPSSSRYESTGFGSTSRR